MKTAIKTKFVNGVFENMYSTIIDRKLSHNIYSDCPKNNIMIKFSLSVIHVS